MHSIRTEKRFVNWKHLETFQLDKVQIAITLALCFERGEKRTYSNLKINQIYHRLAFFQRTIWNGVAKSLWKLLHDEFCGWLKSDGNRVAVYCAILFMKILNNYHAQKMAKFQRFDGTIFLNFVTSRIFLLKFFNAVLFCERLENFSFSSVTMLF